MGACLNARVDKVYFGAYEQKGRSLTAQIADANLLNHKTEVVGGVLKDECAEILTAFFSSMRRRQKEEKVEKQ
jgi:tRNA(adenine34) deaminase